jgi:N6-L-threonylcarbamoyladenine synthase
MDRGQSTTLRRHNNIGEGKITALADLRIEVITVIYVISKNGNPLMPTQRHGKVKHLLREGKAKIIAYTPFTIQLTYDATEYTQSTTLGVDVGSKKIGLSVTTKQTELFSAEIELRTDIVNNIATRKQYRRSKRNRKTRYRKPRFNNRKKKKGRLAPSVNNRIDAHLKWVDKISHMLPITKIIAEVASFDIQKIKNPEISGEQYQQGEQLNFCNVREYVLWRDGHKCTHCKGKSGDKILSVHHIESRKTGGDAPNNLITLCTTCHDKHHDGEITIKAKRGKSFKDAAFMGIMRWAFYERLKELYSGVSMTFGYITKNTRISNGLPKTHATDAYCITGNINARRCISTTIKQVRKKKRSLHEATARKGRMLKDGSRNKNINSKRNSKNTTKITVGKETWCLHDKVIVNGKTGFISGFTGNSAYVKDSCGNYVQVSKKNKKVNAKFLTLVSRNNNWVIC